MAKNAKKLKVSTAFLDPVYGDGEEELWFFVCTSMKCKRGKIAIPIGGGSSPEEAWKDATLALGLI